MRHTVVPVRRVMVGTDRSETADQAVQWAASFAERYGAELIVVQVVISHSPAVTEYGAAERTRADAAGEELAVYARQLAGERGRALVIVDDDPAMAIIRAVEREAIDVLVVGNVGMAGRKEFLLGNIPNRISHNARCIVVIVNTFPAGGRKAGETPAVIRSTEPAPCEPRLMARGARIAAVISKYGLKELFGYDEGSGSEPGKAGCRSHAQNDQARYRGLAEGLSIVVVTIALRLGETRPGTLP
jgi:ubiquinone biosynthesis protein